MSGPVDDDPAGAGMAGGSTLESPPESSAESSARDHLPSIDRVSCLPALDGRHCPRCERDVEPDSRFCRACGASLDLGEAQVVTGSDPLVGRVIADRYRIQRLVGRGGMGVVYRGEHVHMSKTVAIKLLHGELAAQRDQVRRFKREAEAISRLSNVHTVTVFDYGRSQGLIYLVMEFLEGRDVGWLLKTGGRFLPLRTCMILVQICESLGEAHAAGIIHRDLKPENVFLIEGRSMQDFVKVLDFGLAKMRVDMGKPEDTAHGAILGTPYFMSPEQIRGEEIDQRADIYAMGGLMFAMLTGHPPYRAPTPLAVMARHLTDPVPGLEDAALDPEVEQALKPIVWRCLAKDRGSRYSSAEDLEKDLLSAIERFWMPASTPAGLAIRSASVAAGLPADAGSSAAADVMLMREEFDRFERKLRLRRAMLFLLPVLLVLGIGAGILSLALIHEGPVRAGDVEPNNDPSTASALPFGSLEEGTMGRRLSPSEGDHDWYRFEVPEGEPALVRIFLRRAPNMDLMLQLFREGSEKALVTASEGKAGEDEAISGATLEPGVYYVLVRQDLSGGGRPYETISDGYGIEVEILDPSGWETEPNDTPESATSLEPGIPRSGYVATPGDRDFYCLEAGRTGEALVRLVPPPGLALRLARVSTASGQWSMEESPGPGKEIRAPVAASGPDGGATCLQVAAEGDSADPVHPYVIEVSAATSGP